MSDWNEQYMHAKLSHFMWKINCVHSAISLLRVLILLVESWRKKHNAHTHIIVFFRYNKEISLFRLFMGSQKKSSLYFKICVSLHFAFIFFPPVDFSVLCLLCASEPLVYGHIEFGEILNWCAWYFYNIKQKRFKCAVQQIVSSHCAVTYGIPLIFRSHWILYSFSLSHFILWRDVKRRR